MSKTIYKYEVSPGFVEIKAPLDAHFLSVQCQGGIPQVWALVDTANEEVSYPVRIFGTGHEVPADIELGFDYAGTFQLQAGTLVFHLFIGYPG